MNAGERCPYECKLRYNTRLPKIFAHINGTRDSFPAAVPQAWLASKKIGSYFAFNALYADNVRVLQQ